MATETLSIREPNISHAKLIQFESSHKILIAFCKSVPRDRNPPSAGAYPASGGGSCSAKQSSNSSHSTPLSSSSSSSSTSSSGQQNQISIVKILNDECLHQILFNRVVNEKK